VKLNGRTVTELGTRATPHDRIAVDGKPVAGRREPLYVLLHKPAGIVTTLRDPEGRPTVRALLPRELPRVFPVGRLDVQSTGLLLLTNDGELAARLMHPRHHIPRTYRVKVRGRPDARALLRLRRGVRLDDGPTGPVEVTVEKELPTKTWLRIVVHEGRTHLVRRICHAIGHGAEKLQRVALGPLTLGHLEIGEARMLAPGEVSALYRTVGLSRTAPSAARGTGPRRRRAGGTAAAPARKATRDGDRRAAAKASVTPPK
jgi:23S rRNA pseudouridine2605 synthase